MERSRNRGSGLVLGLFIFLGLATLGYLLSNAAIRFKQYERSVTVKGLSEREVPADIVIWPIQFTVANNEITGLYKDIETNSELIKSFLVTEGIDEGEISFAIPVITDKSAQSFGNNLPPEFRYSATQTVTLYSRKVEKVRTIMNRMADLGKQGIAFTGGGYQQQMEYIYTGLNGVKPANGRRSDNQGPRSSNKVCRRLAKQIGENQTRFTRPIQYCSTGQ